MSTDQHEATSPVEQAAAWLARQRTAQLTGADATAFHHWLKASPENVRAWQSVQDMWQRMDAVRDAPAVLALRESARRNLLPPGQRRKWVWGAALAASFALGMFVWQLRVPMPDVIRVDASSALLSPDALQIKLSARVRDVSTRVGERAVVRLADGSTVTLNTDSAIHVDFSGATRDVRLLQGEAYFEVAKDAQYPFVVSAGQRHVVAVGTAFNVKLLPHELKVALVEGKVRVEHAASANAMDDRLTVDQQSTAPVMLSAGSMLVADNQGQQRIAPLDLVHDVGWREGKLVFQGDRLVDVVAEINRYSIQKLEIRDAQIGDQLLSGVFDPSGAATLARTLESYGMARIVGQTDAAILLGAPLKTQK